ncbi:MAG: alpha-hydroxyketone-type quorum-sensing autoinducer synthase [Pseudomonadota bacterium]
MTRPTSSQVPVQLAQKTRDPDAVSSKVDDYYRYRVGELWAAKHPLKGRTPRPGAIRLRTNDYLGIAQHPHIIESEVAALRAGGHGESVSRVWLHHVDDPISRFEERVASLCGAESALLCPSGYAANVGLIQSLSGPGKHVFIDQKAHISLWEGIKSAGANPVPFRHNDVEHLKRQLQAFGSGLIAVDALYSTDGNIAPLVQFADLAERYGCALIVDETHSFGTQGAAGAGLVQDMGLTERVHFRTMGLSKAVASRGGAIVCSTRNSEFLRYESLPSIFSTSVLPHEVAGYNAALDVFRDETWRQTKLASNHAYLRAGLDAIGYNVNASKAQIIALEAGDIRQTVLLRDALESRGVFGAIFFPPATPEKRCLIRLTVNCIVSREELDRVLSVCQEIKDEVGMADWRSTRRKRRENGYLNRNQRVAA